MSDSLLFCTDDAAVMAVLAQLWDLTVAEQRGLFGLSPDMLANLHRAGEKQTQPHLPDEVRVRVARLRGVHHLLRMCWPDDAALTWLRAGNGAQPFCRRTPLAYMISGGVAAMTETCTYLMPITQGRAPAAPGARPRLRLSAENSDFEE